MVTDFKFEVIFGLRGHVKAATASEATKMAVKSKMHMDTRVIEVAKSDFLGHLGHMVAVMASEAT